MPARNIWRSKRLIYKPVETTDEPFLESLNHHGSDAFLKATDQLPVPQGPRGATQHREFLQSCLLGCIIYLPAPEIEEDAAVTQRTQPQKITQRPKRKTSQSAP